LSTFYFFTSMLLQRQIGARMINGTEWGESAFSTLSS
jgi:hypothetical protein